MFRYTIVQWINSVDIDICLVRSSLSLISSDDLQCLFSLWRRGQHLPAIMANQDIVLDANATYGHVPLQHVPINVLAVLWVWEVETLEGVFVEVTESIGQ